MTFKIGDTVKVKTRAGGFHAHPSIHIGDKGTVLRVDSNYVEIKFPNITYGWWLPIDSVAPAGRKQSLKKRICLKIKDMEDRHKVFLENKHGKLAAKA